MKNQNFSQKMLKAIQKFKRYSNNELIFLGYMIVLCLFLLIGPIVKMDPLWGDPIKFRLLSGSFVETMIIILLCLIVLIWWNFSTKFKNLFLTYFWGRENDSLINFLFLCIMITAFLAIKNATSIASGATSTIKYARWWKFMLVWLFVGIVFSAISVVKWAQKTWKKTKIINVVDEEHSQMESTKEEIKKWLFDEDTMKRENI